MSESKDVRTRNWTFIVYPESAPKNWRDIIDQLHVPWIESPLHDKDVNPDGEVKKPHWHVMVLFSGKKSYSQVKELTARLFSPNPQKVSNAKGMVRYFVHMDNPEKYQYEKADMVGHSGADFKKYLSVTGTEKLKVLAEIQDWIDASDCFEFSELAEYARREHFDDWYEVIALQSTVFLNAYLRSKRNSYNQNRNSKGEK